MPTPREDILSSTALTEAVIEGTSDAVYVKDAQGRYVFVNDAVCRLLGRVREDILGLGDRDLFAAAEAMAIAEDDRLTLQGGVARTFDERVTTTQGPRCFLSTKGPVRDAEGRVTGLFGIARDITELKRAEAFQREQDELFRKVVEASPDGIFVQTEGRFAFLNPCAANIFGFREASELLGRPVLERYLPEQREIVAARIQRLNHDRLAVPLAEERILRPDGRVISAEFSAVPFVYGGKEGALVFVRDLTRRYQVEEDLRKSHRQLRVLGGCNQAMVHAAGEEELLESICGILVEVGAYSLAWVGFAEADADQSVRPVAWAALTEGYVQGLRVSWGDNPWGQGPTGTCIRTGETRIVRFIPTDPGYAAWRASAQRYGYASSIALPLTVGGRVIGALNVYASVPDAFGDGEVSFLRELASELAFGLSTFRIRAQRERADAALRSSEASLRHAEIVARMGHMRWGTLLGELTCSPGLYRVFGLDPATPAERLPELLLSRVHPEDRPRLLQADAVLRKGRRPHSLDFRLVLPEEGLRHCVMDFDQPERDGEGRLLSVAGIIQDVTERRLAEEERHGLESQVEHLQRIESIGRLASGVSHDMNNVLSAIMAMASVLKARHPGDAVLAGDAEALIRAATRGRDLVAGLRDFSRKELGAAAPLDLNDLVGKEAELLERTCLKKVSVRTELAEQLPPILGEAASISNALMNLCANACDAMPQGGTLTLSTRNLGQGFVEVGVQDDGEGMPPEVRARALEPFFTTKPEGKGTGLGLSQVYGTVKAHGGILDIQSEPGRGTRVSMTFPLATAVAETAGGPEAAPAPEPRRLEILLVDDEAMIRKVLQDLLGVLGHQVRAASGGAEALELLEAGVPADLVLLDLNMPGLDGIQTLERLRCLRPDLPVLISTGFEDERVPGVLKRFTRVGILKKPFSLTEVQKALALA